LIVQTRWYGQVVDEAKGNHGFGYDPHFFLPELGTTAAELAPSEKNRISHRGQALRELIAQLHSRA
jgi:XTP/dITP diphosphohydrolase